MKTIIFLGVLFIIAISGTLFIRHLHKKAIEFKPICNLLKEMDEFEEANRHE
jgi:uncharacterized membrane protein (DUF106 family)